MAKPTSKREARFKFWLDERRYLIVPRRLTCFQKKQISRVRRQNERTELHRS